MVAMTIGQLVSPLWSSAQTDSDDDDAALALIDANAIVVRAKPLTDPLTVNEGLLLDMVSWNAFSVVTQFTDQRQFSQ